MKAERECTVVVAASSTSIPEIVGNAALPFEPNDSQEMVVYLGSVLTDQDLRSRMIHKGEVRSAEFSWLQTAKKTLDILA